ncbi:hypothetical protein B0H14DRAFT_2867864 [Mycena olivaceomarginata]|nr:hypothetical protein B0H14DRAFT_2867864 [Mycena olivaceomarginata]
MSGHNTRLTSNFSDCFHLAKEAIEKSLKGNQELVSRRNNPSGIMLGSLGSDSLDDIPPVILGLNIWKWHKSLSSDPEFTKEPGDLDEWVLLNEKWLRDSSHIEWRHGLVTLGDGESVFPNSTAKLSGRTILRPKGPLPGYEVLATARESRITIQPSVEAFNNLDWSNVFVAGGIVLGTLLSVDTADGQLRRDPRWASSDIDVYIYGLSPKEANEKVKHLFDTFCANLPPNAPKLVVRNSTTITFYSQYPLRRIQVVLKLVESPKTVLLNFDLDICAMVGCNIFTMGLIQWALLSDRRASIFKYPDKGYGIRILPSYISSLATRKSASNDSTSRTPQKLDLGSIMAEQRKWTTSRKPTTLRELLPRKDDRASRYMSSFRIFSRCATFWEMVRRGTIRMIFWASTDYNQTAMSAYDDNPNPPYKWDSSLTTNVNEVSQWISRISTTVWSRSGLDDRYMYKGTNELAKYRRHLAFGKKRRVDETDTEGSKKNDLMLQVILPCEFATYANALVAQAQVQAGLAQPPLLIPVVVNENLRDNYGQVSRFREQIARREVYDELNAFARWVAQAEPMGFPVRRQRYDRWGGGGYHSRRGYWSEDSDGSDGDY